MIIVILFIVPLICLIMLISNRIKMYKSIEEKKDILKGARKKIFSKTIVYNVIPWLIAIATIVISYSSIDYTIDKSSQIKMVSSMKNVIYDFTYVASVKASFGLGVAFLIHLVGLNMLNNNIVKDENLSEEEKSALIRYYDGREKYLKVMTIYLFILGIILFFGNLVINAQVEYPTIN